MAFEAAKLPRIASSGDFSIGGDSLPVPPVGSPAAELLLRAQLSIKVRDYAAAARLLGEALTAVPAAEEQQRALLLDLRSGCALQTREYARALDDALLCTKLSPKWPRGWARLGAAQLCSGHARAAASAYRQGLELDGGSAELAAGLRLAQEALLARGDRRAAQHHAAGDE